MRSNLHDHTARARNLARLLDSAFQVPGTRFRFGVDPILGLVPGLGDAVGGAFGFYLIILAFRAGAPPVVLLRMFLNVGADMLLGAIPFLGDLLDAGFKTNLRNLALLERYLERPKETTRKSLLLILLLLVILAGLFVLAIWLAVTVLRALVGALS